MATLAATPIAKPLSSVRRFSGSSGRRRPCPGRGSREALFNACGYLLVNLLKERGHHRVAVLGAKLMVRPGSGTNLFRGER